MGSKRTSKGSSDRGHCDQISQIGGIHLRTRCTANSQYGEQLVFEAADVYCEYSKNRIANGTIRLLARLAEVCGLRKKTAGMFSGEISSSSSV